MRPLAEWLAKRYAQWWVDIDRTRQVWVGLSPNTPTEDDLVVDLSPFGTKPRQTIWTCTEIPHLISPWLESSEKLSQGPETIWRFVVSKSARVAEVSSRSAWSDLARKYPSAHAGYPFTPNNDRSPDLARLDADWSKVAQDWDGVHLSVGGWLTAEDVPYESAGVTTELRDWNMESTVWLRWSFDSVEQVSTP